MPDRRLLALGPHECRAAAVAIILPCMCVPTPVFGDPVPSFRGLGDLPGGAFDSSPRGISADGSVVVGLSESGSGNEGFRWTDAGGMVGLGDLPGGSFNSPALAASADGTVVVGLSSSASGFEAYRWRKAALGGGMTGLGDLPGGRFDSAAFAVSDDGTVVVGTGESGSGNEAFRWTPGGGMVGLGDFDGGDFDSEALGVSADGSVIVGWGTAAAGREAFRWTAAGGMVGLGDLPGGFFSSFATDASGDGSVVIGSSRSKSGNEGFRWTAAGGMVGLGDLPGGSYRSRAEAVSGDGALIVGGSASATGDAAILWDPVNGMRPLHDVLAVNFGLDLTGWTLESAYAISADGTTIVGEGRNPAGFHEAWIATMPEPTTLSMLAFGAFAALGRRRHRIMPTCRPRLAALIFIGFLWAPGSASAQPVPGFQGLGDLAGGGFFSAAEGISGDGSVVVGFSEIDSADEAFRWTAGGGMVGLGDLPGGNFSSDALGVSADGSVVIGTSTSAVGTEAFVWDERHGMRSLQDILVDDLGLSLAGWALQSATGVSDDGLIVVGTGTNPSGRAEAYIATLPEPTTLSLLGLGALVTLRRRSSRP